MGEPLSVGLGLELPWEGVTSLACRWGAHQPPVVREAQASRTVRAASLRLMAGAQSPEAKRSSVAGSFP